MLSSNTTQVSGSAPDPQFNYVTMLLHGDGTNGAQNNTFLDSSTNNFTITRNGNTTQGSFSPYGSNWSNYFNASTSLYNTTTPLLNSTASTFTAEAWVFLTATPTNASFPTMGTVVTLNGQKTSTPIYLSFGITTSNTVSLYWYDGSAKACISTGTVSLNQWTHIAASVNANAITLYINGVSQTLTGTTTLTNRAGSVNEFAVGGNYYSTTPAYISNARVTNTAVYSSSFTPSTSPLTAISGTLLLTCQSNRFVDNSTNAYAFTVSGSPSVQRFNPFGASTAYSTSVIGGSGYFDGSGDFLETTTTILQNYAGDVTIECWFYLTALPTGTAYNTSMYILGGNPSNSNPGTDLAIGNTAIWFNQADYSSRTLSGSWTAITGTWNHLAITRSSNNWTMWLNGASLTTATSSSSFANSTALSIGRAEPTGGEASGYMNGYISNLRIVKSALYTTTFTPPTAPLTAITNTSLLNNFTNGAIFDNAMMNDLETVGNAQISTSVVKYGTGSMYFDGSTSNRIRPPASVNYAFGTGNFTVEAWIYPTTLSGENFVYDTRSSVSTSGMGFSLEPSTGKLRYSGSANNVLTSTSVSANTWTHVAWVRNNGTLTGYINGVSGGSAANSDNLTQTNGEVGNVPFAAVGTTMYIDDLRITKGYARYTSNFTPPTAAFSNTGPL